MWAYCGHFQLYKHFWPLDLIGNRLIKLAIAGRVGCRKSRF